MKTKDYSNSDRIENGKNSRYLVRRIVRPEGADRPRVPEIGQLAHNG
jgi:hypothetical protein